MHDRELIRVMALHALAYCERLFYLEEVEEIMPISARLVVNKAALKLKREPIRAIVDALAAAVGAASEARP